MSSSLLLKHGNMYNKILEIKPALPEKWVVDHSHIYYADDSDLVKLKIESGEKKTLQLQSKIIVVRNYGEEVIAFYSSTGSRIDRNTFSKIEDDDFESMRFQQVSPVRDMLLGRKYVDDDYRGTFLYNIKDSKQVWLSKLPINPIILDDYCFSSNTDKVERIDIETGAIIWTQSISKIGSYYIPFGKATREGEVRRFLGVYKDVLWVELTNGVLLGYDVMNGNLKHELRGCPKYNEDMFIVIENAEKNNTFITKNCLFDKHNGKIILLTAYSSTHGGNPANCYCEVDLNSEKPALTIEPVLTIGEEGFVVQGGASPVFPFDEDYIYTCDFQESKIGLFNRKTKEIEWVHKLDTEKGAIITKMEVVNTNWFVLDYSKKLHVFERSN
ncbi:MAG: PQQ-like beta-propeller repeat protein [Chitinophagaceae bacterium]|nr:PQQ-like beta-propeller repeat protein [Chitinophagaceae bacterium]